MRFLLKLVLLLAAGIALWLGCGLLLPCQPAQEQFLLLRPGWSTRRIAQELRQAGVIRDSNAFLFYHYVIRPRSLKAGEYRFDQAASAIQVHARLVRGDIFKRTVVVPEGFNIFDIATAVENAGLGARTDFLKAATVNAAMIHDLDPRATSLEGYLFPDTYEFTRIQSMTDIVSAMVRRFRQEARGIGLLPAGKGITNGSAPDGMDLHDLVTLASIVEKETSAPEERPMVAGVYRNRLAKGMLLNADPCLIYAALLAGHYDGSIYRSDLQSDSPYNTYRRPGLPPGPIANPGREALKAAMHPAASPYLYFVSDGNGHHRFARTLGEHSRNVALYRRAVAR
jgi:UPF0755 protein